MTEVKLKKRRRLRVPASHTAENYLKGIYKLSSNTNEYISTNSIAEVMNTTAASVTDMLKKLADKKHIKYEKYHGVRLTDEGEFLAKKMIRNHRLWETFLVNTLDFNWTEVHDLAEELEHINSDQLIKKLDDFLGHPKYDPHGDPIPDEKGNIPFQPKTRLSDLNINDSGVIVGIADHTEKFLNFLDSLDLKLGSKVKVVKQFDYDNSLQITINGNQSTTISSQVSKNLLLTTDKKK